MKRSTFYLMLAATIPIAIILCAAPLLLAAAKVGDPAPTFTATASDGKTYKLGDYRGKYVVLEWHNNGCPYVGKQYNSGNMQKLQKQWTGKGVVWFTILSSAPRQARIRHRERRERLHIKNASRAHRRATRSQRRDRPSLRRENVAANGGNRSAGRRDLRWRD